MTRQAFIRVLLSLLLLVSQQMASSHVLSHLTSSLGRATVAQVAPSEDDGLKTAIARDEACSNCLAFAQLAGPLGSTPAAFVIPVQPTFVFDQVVVPLAGARVILAFQSRGPPVLS